MGRRRIYQHHSVPGTVAMMVQAIIQDYPRRKRIIEYSSCADRVMAECDRINAIIETSINTYEPMLSAIIISDIINSRGYDRSEAANISSKNTYYNVKHKIFEDIATKCNFI